MEEGQHIVILGGGFGGVMAAKELHKRLPRSAKAHVTLIDKQPAHVFIPLLYEVATAFIEHGRVGTARLFNSGAAVGFRHMLSRWDTDFVQATVTGIDWQARTVALDGHEPVAFDHLIIALGSDVNYFGVEGLQEHAATLKTLDRADDLRQAVHDYLHRTEKGEEERFDVLIGGAGPTGVELASELTMFIRKHLIKGHLEPSEFRIALVEMRSKVLPVLDDPFPQWAKERLEHLGVKLYLDTAIKKVENGNVTLCPRPLKPGESPDALVCEFKDQKVVKADLVVWTGGVKGSASLEKLGIPLEGRGHRIKVGQDLRVTGFDHVHAIGDAVELDDPSTGRPVPWLAQTAMTQGQVAACNVVADIAGTGPATCALKKPDVIVTLGGKYGVASVKGMRLRGWIVWLLREGADLRYFLKILPFWRALGIWWRGITIYSKND